MQNKQKELELENKLLKLRIKSLEDELFYLKMVQIQPCVVDIDKLRQEERQPFYIDCNDSITRGDYIVT